MAEFVSNEEFEKKFDELLKASAEVAIGSAYLDERGLKLLTNYLKKVSEIVNKRIRILLSDKFHEAKETRKRILDELNSLPNVDVRIYCKEESRFHAKLYIFSTKHEVNILSGSYNMTGAATKDNREAGYLVSGKEEDPSIKEAMKFFKQNWEQSMECKEFMEKEAKEPDPKFKKGDRVYVIAKPGKRGIVDGEPIQVKQSFLYQVFFSVDETANYKEEQLAFMKKEEKSEIITQMLNDQFALAPNFLQALTLIKLAHPLTDNLYAFMASRTDFNAYQFKPVLKFLKSPFQRILIADEVGVGKTIEAGIIYTELKARKELENVLIVCPKALMRKWRDEMESRFDEYFEIITSDRLKNIFRELSRGKELINFRGICSLQLLRAEGYLEKMRELSLHFDLVIVDEAHHMRNRGNSFNLGLYLSYASDGMVFLTATPMHLGTEDFYNLIHLLLPEEFKNFSYFHNLIEPNQYLNSASSLLKIEKTSPTEVLDVLKKVENTAVSERFINNPEYLLIKNSLESSSKLDLGTRLELQNKINNLNPLSTIYTRTRKSEVMEQPIIREPYYINVSYSKEEKSFYDLAIEYATYKFTQRNLGSSQGVGFATIMIQRQVASCIPAMIGYLKELLKNKKTLELSSDDDYIAEDSLIEDEESTEKLDKKEIAFIEQILALGEKIGDRDSKFDKFIETVDKLLKQKDVTRIMTFSYFKKTLQYLKEKLTEKGYRVGLIHGDIKDLEERERITEQLRDGEIDILLSSEVAGEGLDFEFCNCMINYDLPWNPMKIEQRIGRLDRYGQKSPKILIYNLSVEDTVEFRIFGRLYQRIQLIEKYVGELGGILGKEIRDLRNLVVSTKLSTEEEEEKIEQIGRVIEQKKIELKEFEKERAKFMGQDDYFTQEITKIKDQNKFISSDEIKNFVNLFLKENFPSVKLTPDDNERYSLKADSDFMGFLEKEKRNLPELKKRELRGFIKKLEAGDVSLTFESASARYNKRIEFITLRHPFVKSIVSCLKDSSINNVGKITIKDDKNIGDYVFFTYIMKTNAAKTMLEMHTCVIDIETLEVNKELSQKFNSIIIQSESTSKQDTKKRLPKDVIFAAERKALEYITSIQDEAEEEIKQANDFLIDSQIESQKALFNYKIQSAEKRISEDANERIIKMKKSEIERLKEQLKEKIDALEKKRLIDISFNAVAGGILHIKK